MTGEENIKRFFSWKFAHLSLLLLLLPPLLFVITISLELCEVFFGLFLGDRPIRLLLERTMNLHEFVLFNQLFLLFIFFLLTIFHLYSKFFTFSMGFPKPIYSLVENYNTHYTILISLHK